MEVYHGGISLHDRLHDGVLKFRPHFADRGLNRYDRKQFFFGVDPEVRAAGAAPSEAAVRDATITGNRVLYYADAQSRPRGD